MLSQMSHTVLSNADLNAIRKARGFSRRETAGRSQFESFFLTRIGLESALKALSSEEIACLHLLLDQPNAVGIPFFERLYGSTAQGRKHYYGTFTQRYKNTFAEVKSNLIRRGVLLIAEAKARTDSTRMERWRFRFPPEFAPYLPPMLSETLSLTGAGESRAAAARREKVLEALKEPPARPLGSRGFDSTLTQGRLLLGGQPFRISLLDEWQQTSWQNALKVETQHLDSQSRSPAATVQTALAGLPTGRWAAPEQLVPVFKVFCSGVKTPPPAQVCRQGWLWGCLVRKRQGGRIYYRLPEPRPPEEKTPPPDRYLTPGEETARVDLSAIPFDDLEALNALACLEKRDGGVIASPDRVRLGRTPPPARSTPPAAWLSDHIPAFRRTFEQVDAHWGKTILHTRLLVARVKDLGLRVQLERALKDRLIVLSEEFIAFPLDRLGEVKKILKKGGYVVKTVTAR